MYFVRTYRYIYEYITIMWRSSIVPPAVTIGLLPAVNGATFGAIYSSLAHLSLLSGDDKFVIKMFGAYHMQSVHKY